MRLLPYLRDKRIPFRLENLVVFLNSARRLEGVSVSIAVIETRAPRRGGNIMEKIKQAEAIRLLNDQFRSELPSKSTVPGQVMLTQGIQQLTNDDVEPGKHMPELFKIIREFDDFDESTDPYGEHDFGAFDFADEKVFWKIDYYAPDMMHASEDPTDLQKTMRVLTIMLDSEY